MVGSLQTNLLENGLYDNVSSRVLSNVMANTCLVPAPTTDPSCLDIEPLQTCASKLNCTTSLPAFAATVAPSAGYTSPPPSKSSFKKMYAVADLNLRGTY